VRANRLKKKLKFSFQATHFKFRTIIDADSGEALLYLPELEDERCGCGVRECVRANR
jgi:hypothetical protein